MVGSTVVTSRYAITMENVSKRFRRSSRDAVSHLTLRIKPGRVVGLLGENGAGKSTTLNMLSTLLRPTTGSLRIAGFDALHQAPEVRLRVAILFGSHGALYGRLTARENIRYFGLLHGLDRRQAEARAEELVRLLGMADYADRRVATYSTGMKQRASLARCIVHDPEVLLLDEPTAGLDLSAAWAIHRFLKGWAADGKTVLFSSHHLDEILSLCERAVVLHRGVLALDEELSAGDAAQREGFRRRFTELIERDAL